MLLLGIHLISTSIVYMVETYYNDESPDDTRIFDYSLCCYPWFDGVKVLER